ncbi:MAG TPA: hypothetical protein VII23_13370 [Terriglobales bacterium]
MPKLVTLIACEKVIIDQKGLPSLISVFQKMEFMVPHLPVPADAVAANQWVVAAFWQHTDSEIGVPFKQHLIITTPDGKIFAALEQGFIIPAGVEDRLSKNFLNLQGFPVGAEGPMSVTVWLDGDEANKYTYMLYVKYLEKPSEDAAPKPN